MLSPPKAAQLIVKPLMERLDLRWRVRRKEMIDRNIRWRDQDRFGVRQRIESILAVIVSEYKDCQRIRPRWQDG